MELPIFIVIDYLQNQFTHLKHFDIRDVSTPSENLPLLTEAVRQFCEENPEQDRMLPALESFACHSFKAAYCFSFFTPSLNKLYIHHWNKEEDKHLQG